MPDSQQEEPGRRDRAPAATDVASPLVLCGARLADGRTVDVRLGGGRIEAVGTAGSLAPPHPRPSGPTPAAAGDPHALPNQTAAQTPAQSVDLTGYLLLPAPAEPHAHYDTALTARCAGPPPQSPDEAQRRATEAALTQLSQGATAVRTHVHIGDVAGLRNLEAVLAARRALRGLADLTAVAVPRVVTGAAGADGLAMLREALDMGATVVGGCPDLDPDPAGCTEALLSVAADHGCAVDLHTDGDDPARLARLAAAAGGLRPSVTVGPCGGMARLPREVAQRAAEQLAAAGMTVVCLPQGGCGLMTRQAPERVAPVGLLRAAGVRVAAGSGALRDTANPVGRGDPLEAAYLLASLGEARPEAAYEAVSARAREALGLPEVRVEAGFPAELVAVRGESVAGALSLAYSRLVVHRGRVVARTSAVREFCDSPVAAALGLPRQSHR